MGKRSRTTSRLAANAEEAAAAVRGPWLNVAARTGYAAQGLVYVVVGVLATRLALGVGGSVESSRSVLVEIAREPFGHLMLLVLGAGLAANGAWRVVGAIADADRNGVSFGGVMQRLGGFIAGIGFSGLAVAAFRLATGQSLGESPKQEWTARLMAHPAGVWLVGFIGVVLLGVAFFQFYQIRGGRFLWQFDEDRMGRIASGLSRRLGQLGMAATGTIFVVIGVLFVRAALTTQPETARGLGAALRTLASQPYGRVLLGATALGLTAFGLYSVLVAIYRRIPAEG